MDRGALYRGRRAHLFLFFLSLSHQKSKSKFFNFNSGIAPSELTPALVEAFEREARASAVTKRSAQNAVGGGLSWDE